MPLDRSGKMSLARLESSYWIEEDLEEFGMDTQTPKCKCWLWNFYSSRVCVRYFSPHSSSSMFAISPLTDKPSPPTCKCLVWVCSHPRITERRRKDRGHVCTQRLCSTLHPAWSSVIFVGEKKKKGKDGYAVYNTYLANFQKKLIIINYAYIDTSKTEFIQTFSLRTVCTSKWHFKNIAWRIRINYSV